MNITQVRTDLAKRNFQVHGVDARGKVAQQAGLLTLTEGILRVVTHGGGNQYQDRPTSRVSMAGNHR
jgi:hypothetical protein